ncbi:MAG: hypothetical protein H6R18_1914 [Proteobacteria bacterium]|nr:hypothetical protein [Pseudomonadota bacterium]
MSARPIIPGRLYHVRGSGIDIKVIAAHGCDAICNVLQEILPCVE